MHLMRRRIQWYQLPDCRRLHRLLNLAGAKIAKQLLAPRASRLSRYKRSDRSERQALLIPL